MGSLFEWITDWIKEGLIDAITGQYTSIFNSVNNQVADVANQVGQTPQGWNGGVFSMIQNLSETVVIPIAGMILTFVLVYELIQMILEKNNMHEFDTFNIFKWIFKTFVATYLLTNCFTIVMAVFDVAQNVVSQSAGVINGNLDVQAALSDLKTQLEAMGMWELIGLWLETNIINLCMWVLSIVIFVIVYIPTPGEYRKLKGKDYYNVSRTNGVWSTSTVLRILEDQRYIGTYVIGKRKVKEIGSRHTQLKDESEWFKIPNHHPAIVSVDLFEKANASIKRFSLSNKKPRDYLLRGKVFCGCCDHAMSLRNGAWFYCRHSEVAETLPCHGVRIKMADLEQVVFETIRAQMCPALGIDSNKDKLDLQTVQQAEHEEKLRSIQDSKRHLYEQYALGEIDLETYRTRKAVYDTELVQAKNVHAVITAQTKQIKSDYEIKLKQQEIVQEVGNANMLTKALIDRLINKVYVFPGDRIEIEYATQDFLETKQSEKEV